MIWKKLLGVFWFATGLVIGIGCARIWFALYPRPGPASPPAPAQIVISPPASAQAPTATIRGQASGTARRIRASTRPQETRSGGGEGTVTPAPEIATPPAEPVAVQGEIPTPSPAPASSPEPAFLVGERAKGAVQGEIEIVDTRGRPLTTEPLRIEGDYFLEFPGPGGAELSLRFESPAVLEVHEPARTIRLGASAGWMVDRPFAAITAEYERRWKIIGDLAARMAVEAGWAWTPERDGPIVRMEAGIEYRF